MSLIRDAIPDWLWVVIVAYCAIAIPFAARKQRFKLLTAAAAPGAGKAEQDALTKQTFGGVGLAAMVGSLGIAYLLPERFTVPVLITGFTVCCACLLRARLVKA